ncbi:hypothetical protein AB2B38_001605 [Balneola sp. MJW-20]|uniref:hypothetical protein n=1 Tax=Gracilimonas aurantiaca TaxID=3234185 RepID=UPI0034A88690
MEGANIRIIDLRTGETLAEGRTEGETGNTKLLVQDSGTRYGKLAGDGDAEFNTVLKLTEPTKIQIIASAPLRSPNNMISISNELWMIPGKHIDGDGFIMEMPGLSVKIQEPLQYLSEEDKLEIKAEVIMLCGCPTEPEGLWDSSEMDIEVWLYRDGQMILRSDMNYTGRNSTYAAALSIPEAGEYQVYVTASDPRTANSGVDSVLITY